MVTLYSTDFSTIWQSFDATFIELIAFEFSGIATAGATVMSEEIESTPKVNCGVWTAIENYINKENNEKIWDNKNVPPKVVVTRKKEKLRSR